MHAAGSVPEHRSQQPKVAVLIPCYNEERTIAAVIRDFRRELPQAKIYVFDNDSTDRTVEEATRAGAIIGHESRRGKGYVMRMMFRQADADVYVMVDGDGTYPTNRVHDLIEPVLAERADMVIGSRLLGGSREGFKLPNLFGNWIFLFLLNTLFRVHITDLLSGYRALSRRVVKSVPFVSRGFEIETELTIKCLERDHRILEIPVTLSSRPVGSRSKINVIRDTFRILDTLLALVRDYKPLTAFGLLGLALIGCGMIPGVIVIREFLTTRMVRHFPSAVLAVGLVLTGLLVAFVGLVLHTIARRFQELDYQLQELLEYQAMTRSASHPSTQ